MIISLVNFSKVSDADVQDVIRAINRQITQDFEPYWSMGAQLRLEGKAGIQPMPQSPAELRGDAIIYLWDQIDVPGVLGYHAENNQGIPYGFVLMELSAQLGEPWSVTLSHEALELIGDANVNQFAAGPHPDPNEKGRMVFHWYEMCDAVQAESYNVDGIKVSDFVLPLYFTIGEQPGGRNDFLGTSLKSFRVNPGGYGDCSKITGPLSPGTRIMSGSERLVTPFALGFSPHIQRNACFDLLLCPHTVDALLPLARATVTPFHRMRGRWQPLVIQKDPRLLHSRCKELLEALSQMCEPVEASPEFRQCIERRLHPATPVEQRRDLLHHLAQLPQQRQTPCDAPPLRAFAWLAVRLDQPMTMREHLGPRLFQALFLAGRWLGGLRTRTSLWQCGLLGRQGLAGTGHGTQHGFDHLLDHMALADLMRHVAKDVTQGVGIPVRPIGRDTQQRQVAHVEGCFEPFQHGPDVLMGGLVVSNVIEEAFVEAMLDRGEHTEGAIGQCVEGDIARKLSQSPVQKGRAHA